MMASVGKLVVFTFCCCFTDRADGEGGIFLWEPWPSKSRYAHYRTNHNVNHRVRDLGFSSSDDKFFTCVVLGAGSAMLPHFRVIRASLEPLRQRSSIEASSLFLYRITAAALFASCLLVSGVQYIGQPIQCVQDKKDEDAAINEHVMNTFCFVSSTYTTVTQEDGLGCSNPSDLPGLGPTASDAAIRRHAYYIWVPFVLFAQALIFLVPQWYWSHAENGLIRSLLSRAGTDLVPATGSRDIAVYVRKRLDTHELFALAWLVYDILGLVIVTGNFFLTDVFLGGRFRTYGLKVAGLVSSDECVPVTEMAFPKLTKCTFHKFGASGSLQSFDSLCVMALNVVNEKIYVFLWFWFLILVPLSSLWVLIKISTLIGLRYMGKNKLRNLMEKPWIQIMVGVPALISPSSLPILADHFAASDWIFFSHLIAGMSVGVYKTFIQHLVSELRGVETSVAVPVV